MYDQDLQDEFDYFEQQKIKYNKWKEEKSIKLELGKTYLQESASWAKCHYEIIFIDDKIALGKKVWCGIYNSTKQNCGTYELFKKDTGEKYQDSRLCYALTKEIIKD